MNSNGRKSIAVYELFMKIALNCFAVFAILLLPTAVLFCVSYRNGQAFFLGVVATIAVLVVTSVLGVRRILPILVVLLAVSIFYFSKSGYYASRSVIEVENYKLILTPVDASLSAFNVKESGVIKIRRSYEAVDLLEKITLPQSTIEGEDEGFLTRVVEVPLFSAPEYRNSTLSNGAKLSDFGFRADVANVEVHDLPLHSFHQARAGSDLKVDPFGEHENITWTTKNPGYIRGVAFSYICPEWRWLAILPVISSYVGVSSWSTTIVVFVAGLFWGLATYFPLKQLIKIATDHFAHGNKNGKSNHIDGVGPTNQEQPPHNDVY